jgi:hypothetical protein
MLSFAVLISEEKVIIARCSIEQFTITASMQQFLFEHAVFLVTDDSIAPLSGALHFFRLLCHLTMMILSLPCFRVCSGVIVPLI